MDTSAAYQIVFVDDAGNRTTIDSVSKVADGVVVFWVPHFSTYEIVKVSAVADTAPAAAASATTTVDAAAVDAQFYTCKACGYHNWTGTVGGYKCDHCGHIEAKDLSSYPNVKGTATLPTATSAAASNNIIKATGADMSRSFWLFWLWLPLWLPVSPASFASRVSASKNKETCCL